jgi:hypothetical protein
MKFLLSLSFFLGITATQTVFDFKKSSDISRWRIVNDGVMGGLSAGDFMLNKEGHAVFKGSVSLENNGGFSSVRYVPKRINVAGKSKVVIRLKGDGKKYQFRVKANARDYYSYITSFKTSGKWEEVEISLNALYPSFRGRTLNEPNFSNDYIEELTFLIANKRKESFELMIDKIELSE